MRSRLENAVLATALACCAGGAMAAGSNDLDVSHDLATAPYFLFVAKDEGEFVDTFTFTFASGSLPATASFTIDELSLGSFTNIDWDDTAAAALVYRRRVMLNHGFSERVLSMAEVENQQPGEATPTSESPALIAYVRMIGLEAGDTAHIVLRAPDGTVIAEKRLPALERAQAQTLTLIGRKRPGASWPAGTYRAEYQVTNAHHDVSLDVIVDWVRSAGYRIDQVDDYATWHRLFKDRLGSLDRTRRQLSLLPLMHSWERPRRGGSIDGDASRFDRPSAQPPTLERGEQLAPVARITEAFVHKGLADMRALGLIHDPVDRRQFAA